MKIRPYTDDEWTVLPHIVFTADVTWDPYIIDGELNHKTCHT